MSWTPLQYIAPAQYPAESDAPPPRLDYIFHVNPHSELMPRLVELARTYRMAD